MRSRARTTARTVLVASVVGAAAFAGGTAMADSFSKPSAPDNPLVERGCVIRFDTKDSGGKTKPRVYTNDGHYCVGVSGEPTVDDKGRLVVPTDAQGRNQAVVSMSIDSDETLTAKGISCGGSGGIGKTVISCYDRAGKQVRADSAEMYQPNGNLWLSWTTWQK